MVRRLIEQGDLAALNLILATDPNLAQAVFAKLEAVNAALGASALAVSNQTGAPAEQTPPDQSLTAQAQEAALAWFKANAGKHGPAAVAKGLGLDPTSKPFKSAIVNLVAQKLVKFNGKRGKGAEYWLA
jgi:hypothetical protein